MIEKNKIATLTFHGVINHGAVLQAYALQKFITNLGYESELINYKPLYFLYQVYRPAKGLSKTIIKYKKYKKFNSFCKKNIKVSKDVIYVKSQLKNITNYKVIIVGSDQVWNKSITNNNLDPVFFLDGFKSVRKIAYAASSGSKLISEEANVYDYLNNFEFIGVREKFLKDEINTLFKREVAEMVLDPTLLITDYNEATYTDIKVEGNYIFSYEVSTDETRAEYEEHVRKLKEILNLQVIHVGDKPIANADLNVTEIGPNDWLALMQKSSFIITNSFHGTAFSVNFRKPFIMTSHIDKGRNARPLNFLCSIGFDNNFVHSPKDLTEELIKNISNQKDYTKLEGLQEYSRNFLENAIKNG
ncbi:polysaccharide pyruvyl transferase family protein [Pseudoalteromonas ulvae]|nr:polysaccharide pyruvyl transferase family protein [Pseudoalteromonas ulvae]